MLDMTDVVPISALTSPRQRIACAPLHAVMEARRCTERRSTVYGFRAPNAKGVSKPMDPVCARCGIGAEVEARIGRAKAKTVKLTAVEL